MDIKIFVSHRIDLDSEIIDSPLYYPVRCGAVFDKRENVSIPGDDTGDNISDKRESFCEFTVLYWAWKNTTAEYYGLCHYRRYMVFSDIKWTEDCFGNVVRDCINSTAIRELGINDTNRIYNKVENNDYIYTQYKISRRKFKNLYDQYASIESLNVKDLELAIEIIKKICPEYYPYAKEYLDGDILYPCNMFVMKNEIFNNFCKWIFKILFELEHKLDVENYDIEGKRTIAYIGERLFGIYITYLIKTKNDLMYSVVQRAVFLKTTPKISIWPYYRKNNVPIVMTSSDFFIPYLSITLQSLLENSSIDMNYDVIILNTNISLHMKNLLKQSMVKYSNISIRFFDVQPYLEDMTFISEAHFSVETFYRLLIRELFINYKKILYLDSDLVINYDISELYKIELNNNLLGATVDADFCGEYNGGNPPIKQYCDEVLKLKNPYKYFQAGVILFDIGNLKKYFKEGELVKYANQKKLFYADQDVLNKKCQGKIYYLDMEWNVLNDCAGIRINKLIKRAPVEIYKRYMKARQAPKIIHYAGFEKPWMNTGCDFAEKFWKYARNSIFYEMILQRTMSGTIEYFKGNNYSVARRCADKWFPKGSKRREVLKSLIPRDSLQWKFLKRLYHKFSLW